MDSVMSSPSAHPCILFVTPEITFFPVGSEKNNDFIPLQSNGLAEFPAGLIGDLFERGADVHITQPDYRSVFADIFHNNDIMAARKIPGTRVHLTEDRAFFYANCPESNCQWENIRISLAFQREVINRILPLVQPDLIHCHGWMTGLIPAMARRLKIPCIFTFQNLETCKIPLSEIEDRGIDAAACWHHLFYYRFPVNYEETRETNPVDFLLSGIFAAEYTSVAGPVLLVKIGESLIRFPEAPMGRLLSEKLAVGCSASANYNAATIQYIDLYESLLKRSVIKTRVKKPRLIDAPMPADIKLNKTDNKDHSVDHHLIRMAG
jgi:starch synthase/alpha-amylase